MADSEFERGQFEGKVLQSLGAIEVTLKGIMDRLDGHSRRIRALELWRAFLTGATAIIGGILGWLGWSR